MSQIKLPIIVPTSAHDADEDVILKLREAAAEQAVEEPEIEISNHLAAELDPHAAVINHHLIGLRRNTVAIGLELLAVKKKLKAYPKATFGNWLKRYFGWDARTAQRYMKVAVFCRQYPEAMELPASAVCLLASSGSPSEVVGAVLAQLGNGEQPRLAEIAARIKAAKASNPFAEAALKGVQLAASEAGAVPAAAQDAAELILSQMREHRPALREQLAQIDGNALIRALREQLDEPLGETEVEAA